MTTMPWCSNSVSNLPPLLAWPNSGNGADYFMSWDPWAINYQL